ncbi:hypothetical protein JM946_21150 [Steroidobacter sp. S1-65]|uniref:HEAT repeat domain-containing protein n=1 Tax=Steroidobacter gossypii TaxID=2805490 RepID=A0ABS1X1Z0_9GAMM|nr:hypothetical protein [Steroidobacter gossypii]
MRDYSRRMHAMETLKYLLIPLRGAALVLVVSFSILLLLAAHGGLLGLPLALLVVSWFFKYGFALLDRVADGVNEPPVLSYEMVNPVNESRPAGLVLVVTIFYVVTAAMGAWFGEEAVTLLRAAGLVLVPAVIMTQAAGSFAQALNPLVLLQVILRVPGSYALVLAVLAGAWWLATMLVTWLPAAELPLSIEIPLPETVRIFILMYAWLASFAMLGGVLYVRRHELGFEPSRSPEREAEKAQRERERQIDMLVDRIFAEWRGGAYGNAWRAIQTHLESSSLPGEDLKDLFERASQWPDPRLAYRLAQELIPRLLASRRTGDALNIARRQLRSDDQFKPLDGSDTIKLIELARDAGDRRTARMLLQGFSDRYNDDVAQRIAGELARQLER